MSERMKNMGRRADDRIKAESLKLRIEALRDGIRENLDQFEPVEKLDGDKVAELGMELAGKLIDYKCLLEEIQKLNEILGR